MRVLPLASSVVLLGLVFATPLGAQTVPTDAAQMRLSFAPVVRKVSPAVVNVYSKRIVRQSVDPFFQMFGGGMGLSRERIAQSLGSGVIVRPDGVIVTNNHVIEGGQDIMVVLGDRREFPAKVLLADPHADIAVLKIDAGPTPLPTLPLSTNDRAQVGDLVLAIGDPFGVGQTVTNGIVSALARSNVGVTDVSYFIQTDAAINPGNSGGALVDMNGDMIGMNTAILSQSGTSSGVGFAIPAALVRHVVDQALGGAPTQARQWLGLKTQGVDAQIARSMGMDRPQGVLVTDVWPGGPADRAGVKSGDLILSVNGASVDDDATLNYRVATLNAGAEVQLAVRKGKGPEQTAQLRLASLPSDPPKDEQTIGGRNPFQGATVVNLSPATADQLGLDPFAAGHGVLVTQIQGGVAASVLRPGDLIRQVNGRSPATVGELKTLLTGDPSGVWSLVIERNGQLISGQIRI